MASIDYCLRLLKSDSNKLFGEYEQNLLYFYDRVESLKNIPVFYNIKDTLQSKFFAYDPGKIVIITKNTALGSDELSKILRDDFKIETERKFDNYVIALTGICDTKAGFTRLADALLGIESRGTVPLL